MNGFMKWWPILMLAILMVGGWMTVRYEAQSALSREEAYRDFVTIEQFDKNMSSVEMRLSRMEDKLDRLLER